MAEHRPGYLRVAVLTASSNFIVNITSNGSLKVTGGFEAPFLNMLSRGLQLQPVIYVSKEDEWGNRREGGKWTGLIGMLQRGEVDIAVSSLLITRKRLEVVDFSYPYSIEDITFATSIPGTIPTAAALIKPFSYDLWIALISSLLIFSIIFHFCSSKSSSFYKTMFTLLGYIMNQPSATTSEALPDRFLIGAWIFGTAFLSKIYGSYLLSFLTVPLRENGMKSIYELSKAVSAGKYKSFVIRGSSILDGLYLSELEPAKIVYEAIKSNNWILDSKDNAYEKCIRLQNCAILRTKKYIYNTFLDDVAVAEDSFYSSLCAIAIQKNSTLKPKINYLIHKISASAVYLKAIDDYLFRETMAKNLRSNTISDVVPQITLQDLEGATMLLILGYLTAAAVCFVEILWKTNEKKCRAFQLSKAKNSFRNIRHFSV